MHKAKIPCSIWAFSVAWKCLQMHQYWQSQMNHSHNQNLCVRHLHQHIVWGREQVLEHHSSNGLTIEGIYQYMLSDHLVQFCQGWEVWTAWTGLSWNAHYCPLRDSYAYVTFNKSAMPRNSQNFGFHCNVLSADTCTCSVLFHDRKVFEHLVNYNYEQTVSSSWLELSCAYSISMRNSHDFY